MKIYLDLCVYNRPFEGITLKGNLKVWIVNLMEFVTRKVFKI